MRFESQQESSQAQPGIYSSKTLHCCLFLLVDIDLQRINTSLTKDTNAHCFVMLDLYLEVLRFPWNTFVRLVKILNNNSCNLILGGIVVSYIMMFESQINLS